MPHFHRILRAALVAALVVFALAACASRPTGAPAEPVRALPDEGPVAVAWNDPAGFAERSRLIGSEEPRDDERWLQTLAQTLRDEISVRLPEGQTASVRIVDAARAGSYESLGNSAARRVRVVRDLYPPLLDIEFERRGADGALVESGLQRLRDAGFLTAGLPPASHEGLRFEKDLIQRWAQRHLGSPLR